jgi:hypothetical protein
MWRWLGLTLIVTACSTPQSNLGEEPGCLLGARAGDGTGAPDELELVESQLGRALSIDRIYRQWDNAAAGEREAMTIAAGRIPLVSFNGRSEMLGTVTWADVASGSRDTDLVTIAKSYRELHSTVLLAFHQTADNDVPEFGTAESYREAFRHVVEVFQEAGADQVQFLWCLRSTAFASEADSLYPGDDVVDWIGANAFNYSTEQTGGRWLSLRALITDFVAWSRPHHKMLALPEFASIEDAADGARKAAWLDDARATLREFTNIRAAVYYHESTNSYAIDSSPQSLEAFRRLSSDPLTTFTH